ncbi:MAG: hypothetical protein M0R46_18015 [Candidatus Muirbacterium halophilum]|nr:hypothetical protein [Candidatus Muirbacterium halophilum]
MELKNFDFKKYFEEKYFEDISNFFGEVKELLKFKLTTKKYSERDFQNINNVINQDTKKIKFYFNEEKNEIVLYDNIDKKFNNIIVLKNFKTIESLKSNYKHLFLFDRNRTFIGMVKYCWKIIDFIGTLKTFIEICEWIEENSSEGPTAGPVITPTPYHYDDEMVDDPWHIYRNFVVIN